MHNIKYQKYTLVHPTTNKQQDSTSRTPQGPQALPQTASQSTPVKNVAALETTTKKKLCNIQLDPPHPPDISKENLGLWTGWTCKNNRQVVREAASKGHVPLAIKFLSLKNNMEIDTTLKFIKDEGFLWVDELLSRKLIQRVLTILSNIGVDPTHELQNIFYKTTNNELRQYIGNFLKEQKILPSKMEHLWILLELIIENKVLAHHDNLLEDSIECLDKKSNRWTDDIASNLFLNTHGKAVIIDNRLLPLVKMEILWHQFLIANEVHLLKTWIQIANSSDTKIFSIPENLLLVFKSFPITEDMIKDLEDSDMPRDSFDKVVNDLAKYGVFIESEKQSFIKVISRINSADSLINVYEVLGQKNSNVPLIKFLPMLVDYCLENNLLAVLNTLIKNFHASLFTASKDSPHLDLMMEFRNLVVDFEESNIQNNIINVSRYLSESSIEEFFCDNPLIFLSLLLLTKDVSIEKAMNDKSLIVSNMELYNCLSLVMKHWQLLASAYFRKVHGVKCTIAYLDLLEKHFKVNVRKVYSFYFEEKPLQSFDSPELSEFAYSKKINYTFYLKQCRPSIASKHFFIDILKDCNSIDEKVKSLAEKKVYKIAIRNFVKIPLLASCISFLEIIGVNSESLRISIEIANHLLHSGVDLDNVGALLLNVDKDPTVIQTLLDAYVVKLIDFSNIMSSGSEFIKAVKLYDVVVKFSVLHNLPLPEGFLRHLTQNNLWFPFVLYAQIKNYPVNQIKEVCSNFKNPNLLEHVVHCVMHDIQVDETNVLMRERDSRQYLLSRLGVRRSVQTMSPKSREFLRSKSSVSESFESIWSSFGPEMLEIDISNTKATLLQILIRCHNSTDPPKALLQACQLYRNPLLAILATSYEPDSVITNWLTWLAVSTDLYEIFTNFEAIAASGQEVTNLLDNCIKNRFPKTLSESFIIFIPSNPLMPFVDFLNTVIRRDYDIRYLIPKLDTFRTLKSNRRSSVISQTDYEMTYLKNKVWIETTALQFLCSAIIYNTESHYDQLEFVKLLCKINIENYFSCEIPKFKTLLEIFIIVFDTDVKLNLIEFLDSTKEKASIQNCIGDLVKCELFDEALKVAQCMNMETDMIVLKKWQNKFEQTNVSIQDFLTECHQDFVAENVTPEYAISFFKERVSVNDLERYFLLKFSHRWASDHNLPNKYQLERKKILAFVKLTEKHLYEGDLMENDSEDGHKTYKEMINALEIIKPPQVCLTKDCLDHLSIILNESLDKGNFWFALKLERMFGCSSNDLDILKLCHGLAEGLVLPHQLNDEQEDLITRVKEIKTWNFRRRSLSYKSTNVSSDKNYLELIEEDSESSTQDTLGLIHSLIEKLSHGSDLAYSVFMKYRISCNIEVPYDSVVSNTDYVRQLKNALQGDCSNKLEVIHDFLEVFHWPKEDVTNFVCEQFVSEASRYSKSSREDFTMWDIKVGDQFHLVLKLFKDECSTLGYKLYNYASAVHQEQVTADLDFKISEMSLVVELLIAAHNCFTADCNMEGISTILKKCRAVISDLLKVRSWKLIVRLFTGVKRYTELNFVFVILKENDQFEFLLSKGSKRDQKLKLACVEHLKKFCPQNRELYKMVALHFTLYSEIASVWEREAQAFIKQLLTIAKFEMQNSGINVESAEFLVLTKSDGTKLLLNKALENYVHASEFHLQGDKLSNAMNAVKQAELIALQKSLLKGAVNNDGVPCLLGLSGTQIRILMCKKLDFHQAYILVQAYNCQPDWPKVLYDQVILNNNISYFDAFNETVGINENLVQDVAREYRKCSSHTLESHHIKNMKYIIEKLTSTRHKYRLASELGYCGLANDILEHSEISHLKDTVWKKGYKN